jgi:hypothetical protein
MRNVRFDCAELEHREAVRLAWESRHVPIGSMLLGLLMLGSLVPTILTIMAQSGTSAMP